MGRAINAIVEPEDIPVVRLRPASPCVALAGFLGHAQLGIDQCEFQTHQRARRRHVALPSGPAAKRSVVMYRSPVSGRITTIILPSSCGRPAIASAAWRAAPEDAPAMMPSVRASLRAVAKVSTSLTAMTSSTTARSSSSARKPTPMPGMRCSPGALPDSTAALAGSTATIGLGRQGLDHYGHRRSTPRTTRGRDVLDKRRDSSFRGIRAGRRHGYRCVLASAIRLERHTTSCRH